MSGMVNRAACVLTLMIASGGTPAATNLVIGLLLPQNEPLSLSLRQGVELGVEEYQASNGCAAKLIVRGAVGHWGTDGVEAARLVTDDGAQGLIAPPNGAASHLALQIAGRTAVPVISLCGDSSVTQTGVPWTVRVAPRTLEEATAIFSRCRSTTQRWVACVPEERRGREIVSDLNQAARTAEVLLTHTIEVKWPMANLAEFCNRLLTNGPDGILIWLDPLPAASIVRGLKSAGFNGQLGGAGWLRCLEFETAAGPATQDFMIASPARPKSPDPRLAQFVTSFRARFGREPDAMSQTSYDAAQVLLEILNRARERPAHEFFPIAFCFSGVTGVLSFDELGNRKVVLEVQKGHGGSFGGSTRF